MNLKNNYYVPVINARYYASNQRFVKKTRDIIVFMKFRNVVGGLTSKGGHGDRASITAKTDCV